MVIAGVGLFHSHYVVFAELLATSALHYGLMGRHRQRLRPLLLAWAVLVALCAPFAMPFATPTYHKFRQVREGLPRVRLLRRRPGGEGPRSRLDPKGVPR